MVYKSLTIHQKKGGRSLKWAHCKRNLVSSGKQAAYKLSGTKRSLSSLKKVPRPLLRQDNTCSNDNTIVVSYINKEGGMRSGSLCALLWRILTWCTRKQVTQSSIHSRPAEHGSRQAIQAKPDHPNGVVSPSRDLPNNMQQVAQVKKIDLFATRFNNKLPLFVSPVPDPLATAVDALGLPWEDLDTYAFPPSAILGKVVEKLQDSPCKRIILIAPGWPNMPWFWDQVAMSS